MVGIRPPAGKRGRARIPRISWTMLKKCPKEIAETFTGRA
jgi:hypothetical protein